MRRITATAVTVSLALGVLAGCGGGSDNADTGGSGSTETTVENGAGDENPLAELAAKASDTAFKVTYRTDDGESITIAQDGKGRTAFTTGDSTIYSSEDGSVSCDGTGPDAECTELPLGNLAGGLLTAFTAIFSGLGQIDTEIYGGELSDETIAGRAARCATFTASDFAPLGGLGADGYDPTAEVSACVDAQTGLLLRLGATSEGEGGQLLEATAVSEPTDADFEPPTTPQTIPDLPDLPDGITIPSIPSIPGEG